jgi:hypothetical protein
VSHTHPAPVQAANARAPQARTRSDPGIGDVDAYQAATLIARRVAVIRPFAERQAVPIGDLSEASATFRDLRHRFQTELCQWLDQQARPGVDDGGEWAERPLLPILDGLPFPAQFAIRRAVGAGLDATNAVVELAHWRHIADTVTAVRDRHRQDIRLVEADIARAKAEIAVIEGELAVALADFEAAARAERVSASLHRLRRDTDEIARRDADEFAIADVLGVSA